MVRQGEGLSVITRLIIFLILTFTVFLLSHCSRRTVASTSEVTDSTHIEYRDRIIEVPVPGDTVREEVRIECDEKTNKPKPVTIKKKSGRATLNLKVNSSGKLTATATCDSLNLIIAAQDKEIYHLRRETKTTHEVRTEFKTRGIDIFCRWFSLIIVILLAVYIYLRINRLL